MELKTYIEITTLAAYLRGVAQNSEEADVLNEAADRLIAIAEKDLPFQLK
jgi:hypothetical protein